MKNALYLFFKSLIPIVLSIFIYIRYHTWGISSYGIIPFIVIINLIFFLVYLSFKQYNKALNPCSAYLIFVFLFAYSVIPISENLHYTFDLLIIILLGIVAYWGGLVFPIKYSIVSYRKFSVRTKRFTLFFLTAVSLFSFLYEINDIGYIPFFAIWKKIDVYGDIGESMSFFHTFVLLAPVLIFWVMILHRQGIIGKKWKRILLVVLFFIFINNFGRTSLLMFAIIGWVYLDYYYKFSSLRIMTGAGIFVVAFIVMGNVRSGSTTDVINQVLRNIANTKYETSIMESYLVSYSSVNFYKMNDLIAKKQEIDYSSYGKNAIKPICKLLKIEDTSIPEFQTQYNLMTYLADPYLDFGLAGVVLFSYLYACIARIFFRKYRDRVSEEYVVSWGLMVFCILMMCFFNAFNTMLVWIIYFTNKVLLKK